MLFGYRYAVKTRKFMPSGLLAIASLVVLAVMFLRHGLVGARIVGAVASVSFSVRRVRPLTRFSSTEQSAEEWP